MRIFRLQLGRSRSGTEAENNRFRLLTSLISEAVVVHKENRIRFVNERFSHLFGYEPHEIAAKPLQEVVSLPDRPSLPTSAAEQPACFEGTGAHKSGASLPVEIRESEIEFEGEACHVLVMRDISRQKQVRAEMEGQIRQLTSELATERSIWRALMQSVADEVWVSDSAGNATVLVLSTATGLPVHGGETPLSEYLRDKEILTAESEPRPAPQCPLHRSVRGEIVQGLEMLRYRATGEVRHRQFSATPVRNTTGEVTGGVAIFRDITERKRSEQELAALRNRLAVELGAMIWLHELSSRLVRLDNLHPLLEEILDAAIEITNADMGSIHLLDTKLGTLRVAAQRRLPQPYLDFVNGVEYRQIVFETSLKDRERVIVEDVRSSPLLAPAAVSPMLASGIQSLQCTPLYSREGGLVGILSTQYTRPMRPSERDLRLLDLLGRQAADLIERAQTQQALRHSEERLRLTAEVARIGTFDATPLTSEVFWSRELRSIVGVSPEYAPKFAMPGEDVALIHPEDKERIAHEISAARDPHGTGEIEHEYRIVHPDGAVRWILVKGRVFFDSVDGRTQSIRITGTVLDITGRKQAEEILIRTEKLASAARMAATVAHEINNPLAAITNAVFLAASDTSLSERTRSRLQLAQHELERVANLTRQTLGFYRGTSSPSTFKLSGMVERVVGLYETKLQSKRINLERDYCEHDDVLAVAGEVRQIISNLLANAIDAVAAGGCIWLRTKPSTQTNANRMTVFTLADNGIGIASEEKGRVFEPFFTTKELIGTGLGLWVTKELVVKSQGNIRVRSRRGQGTVFRVWLPAEQAAKEKGLLPAAPSAKVA